MALSANTSVNHFILCCFTFPPCVIARFAPTRVRIIAGRVHISASSGLIEEFAKLNCEKCSRGLPPVQHSHEYNWSLLDHIKLFNTIFGRGFEFVTSMDYFQLQLGCVFFPLNVNCFTLVPSASMDQICSLPERLD